MNRDKAQKVAEVLKAIGHPIRLNIIEALADNELAVGVIVERLAVSQAVISRHLGLLKDKGILECRREGTTVYYKILYLNVINLLNCIHNHCEPPNA